MVPEADLFEAISATAISKRYGATVALDHAEIRVGRGQVHALLGENGAGKSTIVKLLSGLVQPDQGELRVFGNRVVISNPRAAHRLGIQTAFQELTLIPDLTVGQNLLLPYEPANATGLLKRRQAEQQAQEILVRFGLADIDSRKEIRELDLPLRQKIEIAKAVGRNPRILLLDEPTSTLSGEDVDWLGELIASIKQQGVTVLFISHRIPEVRMFCDSLSVLRNGKHVGTFRSDEVSDDEVIRLVVGRDLAHTFPSHVPGRRVPDRPVALAAVNVGTSDKLIDASFDLHAGEILGVAALQGMGQLDLFLALFGMANLTRGYLEIDGRRVTLAAPSDAVRESIGISLLPEDRKSEGLFLKLSGRANVSLPVIDRFCRFGWIDAGRELHAVDQVLAQVNVHPRALYRPCTSFSGGNQQKIALAKWLLAESRILLMYDPTRGVDVGTKREIYIFMRRFAERGGSILFYSTEVPELVGLCDRVLVLYRGHVAQVFDSATISEEGIIRAALGHAQVPPPLRQTVAL
jgi:ribose transport system ATP-binding protein